MLFELRWSDVEGYFVDARPVDDPGVSAVDSLHEVIVPFAEVEREIGPVQENLNKHRGVDPTLPS